MTDRIFNINYETFNKPYSGRIMLQNNTVVIIYYSNIAKIYKKKKNHDISQRFRI